MRQRLYIAQSIRCVRNINSRILITSIAGHMRSPTRPASHLLVFSWEQPTVPLFLPDTRVHICIWRIPHVIPMRDDYTRYITHQHRSMCARMMVRKVGQVAARVGALRGISYNSRQHLAVWKDIWQQNEDNFTLGHPNKNLEQFHDLLFPHGSSPKPWVLLPLCGKTPDLVWLAEKKYSVVGVEGVGEPLRQWASINGGLEPFAETEDMMSYRSRWYPYLTLIHGDIFHLKPESFGDVRFNAVWDRGGITSIAPEYQADYVRLLSTLMSPSAKLLIEFMVATKQPTKGSKASVHQLLTDANFVVETLQTEDVTAQYPSYSQSELEEVVMLATKPA